MFWCRNDELSLFQVWYGMIGLHKNYKSSYTLVYLYGTSIGRPFSSSIIFLFTASSLDYMMNIPWWFFVIIIIIIFTSFLFSFVHVIYALGFARVSFWYKKIIVK